MLLGEIHEGIFEAIHAKFCEKNYLFTNEGISSGIAEAISANKTSIIPWEMFENVRVEASVWVSAVISGEILKEIFEDYLKKVTEEFLEKFF